MHRAAGIAAIMILALAALPSLLPGCADFQQSVYPTVLRVCLPSGRCFS
jgi:hypothetical protein